MRRVTTMRKELAMDTVSLGALAAAAAYLGIPAQELRRRLRDGQSLRRLAADHGRSVDGLQRSLLADLRAHLDAAVAAGRISLRREERLLELAPARIEGLVASTPQRGD
jgi:hypothetical protein